MLTRFLAAICLFLAASGAVLAQQEAAEFVESYGPDGGWIVYVANSESGRVCFATSQPTDTTPTNVNRGSIYFMVSTWPIRGVENEVSILIGYPLETGSTVSVTIDNDETFQFFTFDDAAWISNLDLEDDLVVAMQRGITMVVRGRSQRGTDTTDTYSLRGATAALNRVAQECSL